MNPIVFIQNTGAIADGASGGDPDSVTAGKLAVINAATGAEHSMEDTAAPTSFYIVQGHADYPKISPIIKAADIVSAEYLAYAAPTKKLVTVTSVPAGPTGGDTYTVKVVNLKTDTEPFARKNYETVVAASQADEDSIYALVQVNKDDSSRFVDFGCNKIDTKTVTGTNGNLVLTVTDGETAYTKDYTEAFDTNVATTIDNFITSHAADLLSTFGITVTDGTTTAIFTGGVSAGDFTIVDTDSTGDMAASISVTEATSLLIQSTLVEDNFQVFLNDTTGSGIASATQTTTTGFAEGSGSAAQIKALELQSHGRVGNFYRETPQPLTPEVFADIDTPLNYDVWSFLVKTNQEGQSPVKGNQYYQVIIADATAVTGDWNTFLGTS